jgi:dTDP-4-dehydrorhamnose 3,5-epimerase
MRARNFDSLDILTLGDRIPGVRTVQLTPNWDERGAFTEVHRVDWATGCEPQQWSLDHSRAGTFRGMHAHRERFDYVTPVWGRLVVGLYDARIDSPSTGSSAIISVSHADGVALILPPGVAHGFYYPEDSAVLIGFSRPWSPKDDVRCHYLCPELGLKWPGPTHHISASDASAQDFAAFLADLHHR